MLGENRTPVKMRDTRSFQRDEQIQVARPLDRLPGAPVLEDLAAEHAGRPRVAAVPPDDAPGLAAHFEITALPTLIVSTGGRPVKRITPAGGKSQLLAQLEEFLRPAGTAA